MFLVALIKRNEHKNFNFIKTVLFQSNEGANCILNTYDQ